jgi:hypothetical protein
LFRGFALPCVILTALLLGEGMGPAAGAPKRPAGTLVDPESTSQKKEMVHVGVSLLRNSIFPRRYLETDKQKHQSLTPS